MSQRAAPQGAAVTPNKSSTWGAFAWGFAEATVFFIVPDVLITRVAVQDFRRALIACGWALAGALLGGTALWFAAKHGAVGPLLRGFVYIPGIDLDLVAATGQALHEQGVRALLAGGLIGQPYKLFAVHAGAQEVALPVFLAASAVARFTRFVLTATLAGLASRALRNQPERVRLRLHVLIWATFYLIYFIAMR